jgi:hypothetical protein
MPKRQDANRRIVTTEGQGEDSWVVLSKFTLGEAEAVRAHEKQDGYDQFAESVQLLRDHIIDWNWVDYDGTPLAKPRQDEAVLRKLTDDEMLYLVSLLTRKEGDLKN